MRTLWSGTIIVALAALAQGALWPLQSAPASAPARPTRAELEKRLEAQLNGVTLKGTSQITGEDGLKGKAPLSPPQPEQYIILSAHKADGDWWLLRARIQYGEHDLELPLRLKVTWADDTPIITVDEMTFPGMGTYSARVMIYRNFYCGTWFGDCYGGVLSGQIVKLAEADAAASPTPEGKP